jgi:hypothetical protein
LNVHAQWRLAVARRAAAAYTLNPKLAALTVAGSVGAGLADRFSDLEPDCYWSAGPSDRAFQAAETLLADTVALAAARTEADLTDFRAELSERRRPLDPPG